MRRLAQSGWRRPFGLVAVITVVVLVASSGTAAPTGAPEAGIQPDAMIRKTGTTAFLGNNVYNTTGANQTKSRSAARGTVVNYDLRMQNDSAAVEFLDPSGCAGNASFRVRYFQPQDPGPDIDITSTITGGLLSVGRNPGQSKDYRIEVKVKNGAPVGATLTCRFSVRIGSGASAPRDVARLVVHRT